MQVDASPSRHRTPALLFFLILLSAVAALAMSQSAYFTVRHPVLRGLSRLTADEVLAVAGVTTPVNIFRLDPNKLQTRLRAYPPLEEVSVTRRLPNRLEIRLAERRPIGATAYGRHLLLFDRKGIPFAVQKGQPSPPVPLITGLAPVPIRLGEPTSSEEIQLATRLLANLKADVLREIAEVQIGRAQSLSIILVSGVRVQLGDDTMLARKLAVMSSILSETDKRQWSLGSVDLRVPDDPVVKLRGSADPRGPKR